MEWNGICLTSLYWNLFKKRNLKTSSTNKYATLNSNATPLNRTPSGQDKIIGLEEFRFKGFLYKIVFWTTYHYRNSGDSCKNGVRFGEVGEV